MMLRAVLLAGLLGCGGTVELSAKPCTGQTFAEDLVSWREVKLVAKPGTKAQAFGECGHLDGFDYSVEPGDGWWVQRDIPVRKGLPVYLQSHFTGTGGKRYATIQTLSGILLSYAEGDGVVATQAVAVGLDVSLRIGVVADLGKTTGGTMEQVKVWFGVSP